MIKRMLIAIALVCLMAIPVQAAGPTVSIMTEQIANVDKGNSLTVELGYFLGIDSGLEPYIGTQWWPQWDEVGDIEPPSVVVLGVRNHFKDVLDPNSIIPYLPDLLLIILNEDIEIKPYVGFQFTANFIDKNAGFMGLSSGILVKTSPDSNSALRFGIKYNDTFGDLAGVRDNRFDYEMGIFIPF